MRRPLLFLCLCLFIVIALIMQVFSPPPWKGKPGLRGADIVINGLVYDKEFREYEGEKVLILFLKSVSNSNSDFKSKEKIRCEIFYEALPLTEDGSVFLPCLGANITVRGTWKEFARATNPGEFDLARYYGVEGIVGGLTNAEIVSAGTSYWCLREALFQYKQKMVRNLYQAFEEKEASVLAKMLLGDGSGLDEDIRELYQSAGIAHILSISGLHISMLGMGMYSLLKKCKVGAKGAAFWGGIVIVLYGMLTGFSVSACRAIGMYLIHMLGEIWGKTYDMLTAMGVLCVCLLLENPRLVYHSGYLLSFSSVCGVGLLAPVFRKGFPVIQMRPYDKRAIKWLKGKGIQTMQGLGVSLSVTLFTLPIQLFFFYKIPVYSVLINLLVIPFVGMVMVLGFLIMLVPGLCFFVPVETGILSLFERICMMFQKVPGHTLLTGKPEVWKVLMYYVVLLGIILGAKRMRIKCFYGVLVMLVLFVVMRFANDAQITFLDVGQGECTVVQTRSGECFVFDCGSSSKRNVGEKILLPFLQHQGISKIDGLFLSHPDTDHMNGVEQLLKEGKVEIVKLYLPDYANAGEDFAEMIAFIDSGQVQYVSAGMQMEAGGMKMSCLHPSKGEYKSDHNELSACYFLELDDRNILFTGDISEEGEKEVLEEWMRQDSEVVDVLKVAHHGSRFSSSLEFLQEVQPGISVISCGENNVYGHPHEETLERLGKVGSEVLITYERGAIIFK